MIYGIIIGILLWQLISFIILIATNEDEDITIKASCGLWFLLVYIIGHCIRLILIKFHNKYSVVVNIMKNDQYILGSYRIYKKDLKCFKTELNDNYWLKIRTDENVRSVWAWQSLKKATNGWLTWDWVLGNCSKENNNG